LTGVVLALKVLLVRCRKVPRVWFPPVLFSRDTFHCKVLLENRLA
jgi:hypothetical protein